MCRKCKKDFKPFGLIWSVISFVIALILYETGEFILFFLKEKMLFRLNGGTLHF